MVRYGSQLPVEAREAVEQSLAQLEHELVPAVAAPGGPEGDARKAVSHSGVASCAWPAGGGRRTVDVRPHLVFVHIRLPLD